MTPAITNGNRVARAMAISLAVLIAATLAFMGCGCKTRALTVNVSLVSVAWRGQNLQGVATNHISNSVTGGGDAKAALQ